MALGFGELHLVAKLNHLLLQEKYYLAWFIKNSKYFSFNILYRNATLCIYIYLQSVAFQSSFTEWYQWMCCKLYWFSIQIIFKNFNLKCIYLIIFNTVKVLKLGHSFSSSQQLELFYKSCFMHFKENNCVDYFIHH